MKTPLFIPFNVRNQIINENCTKHKDITKLPNQYELLTSYMKESKIFDGINKRLGRVLYSKARANFTISNSPEAFKKGQVMTKSEYLRTLGIIRK